MSAYTPGFGDVATWPGLSRNPFDPRTPEPDVTEITDEEAPEIAADLLRSTPATFAYWLAAQCAGADLPLDWSELNSRQHYGETLTVPQLLALIVCGCDTPARSQARFALVQAFDAAHAEQAAQDAEDMLHAQEREQRELALWGDDMGCTQ